MMIRAHDRKSTLYYFNSNLIVTIEPRPDDSDFDFSTVTLRAVPGVQKGATVLIVHGSPDAVAREINNGATGRRYVVELSVVAILTDEQLGRMSDKELKAIAEGEQRGPNAG